MEKMSKTFPLRMPPSLYRKARERARQEGRPFSNLARRAIILYIGDVEKAKGAQDAKAA